MTYKHLFGPVPSRRLGLSLGVDLVPHKTCSLDCVYCETGATTAHTTTRAEYVSTEAVLAELNHYLADSPQLDTLTFSGAGEPTLHSGLGRIIEYVKQRWPQYRLALITNGTLLGDAALRAELGGLDLILPSLDAVTPEVFAKVNRPAAGLDPLSMIEGMAALRRETGVEMWLEVFLVAGLNDTPGELALLRQAIERIQPHRVQLNTLDRPGTESWVQPLTREQLEQVARDWAPLPVEIIAKVAKKATVSNTADLESAIVAMVERRPCTAEDLASGLGADLEEVKRSLKVLTRERKLRVRTAERGNFYLIA